MSIFILGEQQELRVTTRLGEVTITRSSTRTLMPKRHKTAPTQRTETEAATIESSTVRITPLKAHSTNMPFMSTSIKRLLRITVNI